MPADLVLRGGSVITLDPQLPRATSLAIAGGRIAAVGSDDEVDAACGPETHVVDARGRAVLPGFVDAHMHFGSFAIGRQQLDLDGAATLEDGLRAITDFVARLAAARGTGLTASPLPP